MASAVIAALMSIPGWVIGTSIAAGKAVWNSLSMSRASFGIPGNPPIEPELKHVHAQVVVSSGYLGREPIIGVEPWLVFLDSSRTDIKLLWQNENESDGPEPKKDLQADKVYWVPIVARSTIDGFRLSGRAVTTIPDALLSSWEMRRGIPRITNGAHYYTFTALINLDAPQTYPVRLELRLPNGKVFLEKEYFIRVPRPEDPNDEFFLQPA